MSMSRTTPPLLLALTLVTGMLLGVLLDRRAPEIAAQGVSAPAAVPAPTPVDTARPVSEDAIYAQVARQYETFAPINRTFELVARAVSPAVVHIVAQKTGRIDESARVRHYEETGSGVIVRGDKGRALYVLTNNHVVEGAAAAKINIFLQDGRAIRPDALWLDAKADIAVLNLNREDLPAARLGDSDDLSVGDWVMALGSPFGLTHSVSQGIISARGRHMDELQDVENQDFLQTDAAINPGNSGGPLVNMKAEVIGINNSIASNGGGNEGVGFSIPVNLARWIMNQLVSKGRVTRGALGIDLHPEFKPENAQTLGLDRPQGAWVDLVHESSPAAAAGLRNGDVILRFQGAEVHDLNDLINRVSMAPIGQAAELVVWRARQRLTLSVTVGERDRTIAQVDPAAPAPKPVNAPAAIPLSPSPRNGEGADAGRLRRPERPATNTAFAVGLELQTLDESTARRWSLPVALRGALVMKLATDSPLASQMQPLDVIHAVNGHPVKTAEEAAKALNTHIQSATLLVSFDRLVQGKVESRTVRVP